jgi:hypothetical protein
LLDRKKHPKTYRTIVQELVRNCGWKKVKIDGPTPYVHQAIAALEAEELAESEWKAVSDDIEADIIGRYWRK